MAQSFNNRQGGSYVQYTRGGSAMRGKRTTLESTYSKQKQQEELFNKGLPGESPFKTMYQATIGTPQRAQTSKGGRKMSQTPQHSKGINPKPDKVLSRSAQKLDAMIPVQSTGHRKFG